MTAVRQQMDADRRPKGEEDVHDTAQAARVVPLLIGGLATVLLAACSGTDSEGGGSADGAGKEYTYALITHGTPGNAFWDRIKSGGEQAADDDMSVKVEYSSDPDPAKQSQLIDGAVAKKGDGILVTMANPDGLETSVKAAVAAGIPVITINSGIDQFKDFGAITHVGQSESLAGEAAGEKLKEAGAKNAICVIHEGGNISLEARCTGVAKTIGAKVENLQVGGTDDNAVAATITSKLQADRTIDTFVALGAQYSIDAVAGVEAASSKAKVSTFDLDADVINAIRDGKIEFAVDQQPFVQSYLGVVGLYLKSINGNDIGGGQPVYSGPAFVTKENADAILKFAENGTR